MILLSILLGKIKSGFHWIAVKACPKVLIAVSIYKAQLKKSGVVAVDKATKLAALFSNVTPYRKSAYRKGCTLSVK